MEFRYINLEYLDSVSGGDITIISEIVDLFREQCEEIYAEMKVKLAEVDYKNLGMLAHKAKSSVAIMGMDNLAGMLKTFELQTRDEVHTDLYPGYIERFRADTAAANVELDDFIRNRRQ